MRSPCTSSDELRDFPNAPAVVFRSGFRRILPLRAVIGRYAALACDLPPLVRDVLVLGLPARDLLVCEFLYILTYSTLLNRLTIYCASFIRLSAYAL